MSMWKRFWSWLNNIFGKKKPSAPVWEIRFSPNMPGALNANTFTFPTRDGVHYVTRKATERPSVAVGIRFHCEEAQFTAGNPDADPGAWDYTYRKDQGGTPAVRLLLQRRGDTMGWQPERFWSQPILLKSGETSYFEPLDPMKWTTVDGTHQPDAFRAALMDLEYVGFTFGGDFAGHGVWADRPAKFTLLEYNVT